jgi:hypothetical protein
MATSSQISITTIRFLKEHLLSSTNHLPHTHKSNLTTLPHSISSIFPKQTHQNGSLQQQHREEHGGAVPRQPRHHTAVGLRRRAGPLWRTLWRQRRLRCGQGEGRREGCIALQGPGCRARSVQHTLQPCGTQHRCTARAAGRPEPHGKQYRLCITPKTYTDIAFA